MENKIIVSVCKTDKNSTWANGTTRRTTKGMKMVVTVTGKGSNRKSVTTYEAPKD